MSELVLAIDQGTSATKAAVFDETGACLGFARVPVQHWSPEPDAVEQDPYELVSSCDTAARAALAEARVAPRQLLGAALSNQGESFLLLDNDGRPVTPVISWQDGRSGDVLPRLRAAGAEPFIEEQTGLPLHAEFAAPKLAHLLSMLPSRELRFATLDTWLIHQLDPGRPFVSDRATASRTMLVGLRDNDWSDELLELFAVTREMLPTLVGCDEVQAVLVIDGCEIPLLASSFDMGLALIGHGCFLPGEIKATFGTCLGVMTPTDVDRLHVNGLLTTVPYTLKGRTRFALDGEIAAAGALVTWMQHIGIARDLAELEELAKQATPHPAILVPAITGLGAPYWRDNARAALVGMTQSFGRAEFAAAVFDAIAWSLRDVVETLRSASIAVDEIRVDGGLTASDHLLHRCADICSVRIIRSGQREVTAFGAALLARQRASGSSLGDLRSVHADRTYDPQVTPTEDDAQLHQNAIETVLRENGR